MILNIIVFKNVKIGAFTTPNFIDLEAESTNFHILKNNDIQNHFLSPPLAIFLPRTLSALGIECFLNDARFALRESFHLVAILFSFLLWRRQNIFNE